MAPHATDELASGDGPEVNDTDHHGVSHDADAKGIAYELERYPESGISVLIVGAGMGGLTCALECWRKGHNVQILERSSGPVYTGDNLTIQPSVMSIFRHWPELCAEIESEQYDCWMSYYKYTGEHIYGPNPPVFNDPENCVGRKGPHVAFMQGRVKFYKSLLRQVERLGLNIEYDKHVVDYYEDADRAVGGAITKAGEKYEADVVVAADGLKSPSGKIVNGGDEDLSAKESGMAIYRAAYPAELALQEPLVQEQWNFKKGDRPIWEFWLGAGLHVLVVITHDIVCWGLTHKSDGGTESWSPSVTASEVLSVLQAQAPDLHPAIPAIMNTTPQGTIVHWKLMWRDLRESWTSPAGRVVQVGDSAHSFLPVSGNGATQAMEDSITLAACLQLEGKKGLPHATKVFNKLRYERVSCAQKMAFVNSQIKHNTDWAAIAENPSLIRTRFPRWIYQHDPEAYAHENYAAAFNHVTHGSKFQNTNIPPGHTFRKWTIEEVKQEIEDGKSVVDLLDGDWS